MNGYMFRPREVEVVALVVAFAAGEADERVLAGWISDWTTRKD